MLGLVELFYHEITSAGVSMVLALAVNGYDIKANWPRILAVSLGAGAASALFFYFPQSLRVVALFLLYLAAYRACFGFAAKKIFILVLVTHFTIIVGNLSVSLIQVIGFGITMDDFMVKPLIHFLYPLPYNVPLFVLACAAYKYRWRLFNERLQMEIPYRSILPLFIQSLLTSIILCELIMQTGPATRIRDGVIATTLVVATLLTYFFIWRILRIADHEAAIKAQEQLAAEMNRQSDRIRAQRHDFINHIQVMAALLQVDQKEELARYIDAIMQPDDQ